jgi:hypothetical protein
MKVESVEEEHTLVSVGKRVSSRYTCLNERGLRAMLEGVRELSDAFEVREEICDVEAALENLWMALGGIAAAEEDRRLRGEEDGQGDGSS